MALSSSVTKVLNGSVESIKGIIPMDISVDQPALFEEAIQQSEIGVLIGITGDIKGRLIIEGDYLSFGLIGELMFGIPLEGEMLHSFTGELANMIAGNLSTKIAERNITIDITTPTVIEGKAKIHGFDRAFKLPVHLQKERTLHFILTIEEEI